MDPHKLAERFTVAELVAMSEGATMDPANRNPPGSIATFNAKGQNKIDSLAWAITYRMCRDKGTPFQAATFKNYKTRYFNR